MPEFTWIKTIFEEVEEFSKANDLLVTAKIMQIAQEQLETEIKIQELIGKQPCLTQKGASRSLDFLQDIKAGFISQANR